MSWKNGVFAALAATLGTVGAHTYFNGLSMMLLVVVGAVTLTGMLGLCYVISLGKGKRG
jgi:hypothetical protein